MQRACLRQQNSVRAHGTAGNSNRKDTSITQDMEDTRLKAAAGEGSSGIIEKLRGIGALEE